MSGILSILRLVLGLFAKSVTSTPDRPQKLSQTLDPIPTPKPLLTVQDLITSSGKYPERANSVELTPEVINNMEGLLKCVNPFLDELGVKEVKVSSGFRPSAVNAALANGAKKSLHMVGKAVDLKDSDNQLDSLVESRPDLLEKYGLWLESPTATPSWCHLDIGTRTARKIRIFLP